MTFKRSPACKRSRKICTRSAPAGQQSRRRKPYRRKALQTQAPVPRFTGLQKSEHRLPFFGILSFLKISLDFAREIYYNTKALGRAPSGCGEVWYRAWFGTKRPWVQVPSLRPTRKSRLKSGFSFLYVEKPGLCPKRHSPGAHMLTSPQTNPSKCHPANCTTHGILRVLRSPVPA